MYSVVTAQDKIPMHLAIYLELGGYICNFVSVRS